MSEISENRWNPTKEQKEKFIPMIQEFVGRMEKNLDSKEYIDFYNQGISPSQLKDILVDDLGFEEVGFGSNGWEWDFWITIRKDDVNYMITGTGMTFEMIFRLV